MTFDVAFNSRKTLDSAAESNPVSYGIGIHRFDVDLIAPPVDLCRTHVYLCRSPLGLN